MKQKTKKELRNALFFIFFISIGGMYALEYRNENVYALKCDDVFCTRSVFDIHNNEKKSIVFKIDQDFKLEKVKGRGRKSAKYYAVSGDQRTNLKRNEYFELKAFYQQEKPTIVIYTKRSLGDLLFIFLMFIIPFFIVYDKQIADFFKKLGQRKSRRVRMPPKHPVSEHATVPVPEEEPLHTVFEKHQAEPEKQQLGLKS